MQSTKAQAKLAWDNYWHQGHLTSFGVQFENYSGVLAQQWQSFFQKVPNNSSILDLASGNGAILQLACKSVKDINSIELVGVDYANVSNQNPNIKLLSNVNIEQLPFDDLSFDIVSSQFGAEYADLKTVISEISRVLKYQGKFQLICHHYDSQILKTNRNILACVQKLLSPDGSVDLLRRILQIVKQEDMSLPSNKLAAESIRQALNSGLNILQQEFPNNLSETGILSLLKCVLAPQTSYAQALELVDSYSKEQSISVLRLMELDNAALTSDKLAALKIAAVEKNLSSITVEDIFEPGFGMVGVKITGSKH